MEWSADRQERYYYNSLFELKATIKIFIQCYSNWLRVYAVISFHRLTWTDIDLGGGSGLATVSDSKTALKLGRESAIIRVWFVPSIKKDQTQVND